MWVLKLVLLVHISIIKVKLLEKYEKYFITNFQVVQSVSLTHFISTNNNIHFKVLAEYHDRIFMMVL